MECEKAAITFFFCAPCDLYASKLFRHPLRPLQFAQTLHTLSTDSAIDSASYSTLSHFAFAPLATSMCPSYSGTPCDLCTSLEHLHRLSTDSNFQSHIKAVGAVPAPPKDSNLTFASCVFLTSLACVFLTSSCASLWMRLCFLNFNRCIF